MKKMKLGPKIIIASSLIIAVVITGIGLFSFLTYKNDLVAEYAMRATSIAEMTASVIDPEQIAQYDQTGNKDDQYQSLVDQLALVKKRTQAYYLYIITDTGADFKYIADGGDPTLSDYCDLNDTDSYDVYGPEPHAVLETGLSQASGIYFANEEYGYLISAFAPIQDDTGKTIAVLGMDLSPAEINARVNNYLLVMIIALIASLGLTFGILNVVIRKIVTKPITMLTDASVELTAGNMNLNFDIESNDELGQLATCFSAVVQTLNKLTGDIVSLLKSISEGDYNSRADETCYKGEYRTLIGGVNQTVDSFVQVLDQMPTPIFSIDQAYNIRYINKVGAQMVERRQTDLPGRKCYDVFKTGDCATDLCGCHIAMQSKRSAQRETDARPVDGACLNIRYNATPILSGEKVIGAFGVITDLTDIKQAKAIADKQNEMLEQLMQEVNVAAEQVAAGTTQVSAGSQSISQGATEQASAIEELSASIASIAGQIRDNAARTNRARELALAAKKDSALGNEQMEKLQNAMVEINESSASISKIIKTIDEIAFQTNILALNAAVEAARAGVHGKGFAVVAQEVRSLAGKSAKAAQETSDMIKDSIEKVKSGSHLAEVTAESLNRILSGSEKSAGYMDEIAQATNEQATGIAQINGGIEQLSQVVQMNSATAVEAAAASHQLSSQAEMLKSLVERFES